MEIWKDIPNYEGHYQVSNYGNIKSLKGGKEKVLKVSDNGLNYLMVKLCKDKKVKTIKVHKIVAMAFLNHNPDKTQKIVVDHINNITTDNSINNIQLISHRENTSKDKKGYTSKYIGVFWYSSRNKWVAKIQINGKNNFLGYFNNELDASNSYQKALNKI